MAEQEVQAQVNGTEAGKKSKLDKLKERKKKQKLNKQQRRWDKAHDLLRSLVQAGLPGN